MKILLISVLVIVLIVFIIYVGTGLAFLRLMSIPFNDPESEHKERYKKVLKKKGITGDAADKEFQEITGLFKTTRFKLTIIFKWPVFSDVIAKEFGIEKLSDVSKLRESLSVPK